MTDTWTPRDLPVLIAAAARLDRTMGDPFPHYDLKPTGIEPGAVTRAVVALTPTYLRADIDHDYDGWVSALITGLTDEGRRAAGLWPKRADYLASLIAALDGAAEDAESEEERTGLRRVVEAWRKAPQRISEAVLAALIAGQLGG